jgi:hypothetical protein
VLGLLFSGGLLVWVPLLGDVRKYKNPAEYPGRFRYWLPENSAAVQLSDHVGFSDQCRHDVFDDVSIVEWFTIHIILVIQKESIGK